MDISNNERWTCPLKINRLNLAWSENKVSIVYRTINYAILEQCKFTLLSFDVKDWNNK